jgi:hypothetical protein
MCVERFDLFMNIISNSRKPSQHRSKSNQCKYLNPSCYRVLPCTQKYTTRLTIIVKRKSEIN